jgi:hypothetical protein
MLRAIADGDLRHSAHQPATKHMPEHPPARTLSTKAGVPTVLSPHSMKLRSLGRSVQRLALRMIFLIHALAAVGVTVLGDITVLGSLIEVDAAALGIWVAAQPRRQ